jgi:hypothetical protein
LSGIFAILAKNQDLAEDLKEQTSTIADGLKHDLKPSIINKKMQILDPENLVDLKAVQNDKYLHDNKIKPASSSNMTDDIQNIISSK